LEWSKDLLKIKLNVLTALLAYISNPYSYTKPPIYPVNVAMIHEKIVYENKIKMQILTAIMAGNMQGS